MTTTYNTYTADGVNAVFLVTYERRPFTSDTVYVDGTQLFVGYSYNSVLGAIVFDTPPVAGATVRIQRVTDQELFNKFAQGAAFTGQTLDDNFEQLQYSAAEASETSSRVASTSLRVPPSEYSVDELPSLGLRKGKLLGFDPIDGQPTAYTAESGSATDVLLTLGTSSGATYIGYGTYNVASFLDALQSTGGAALVGSADGNLEDTIIRLDATDTVLGYTDVRPFETRFSAKYQEVLTPGAYPQGLAEDDTYWYYTEDVSIDPNVTYLCKVHRVHKTTLVKTTLTTVAQCHGQGIGVLSDGRVFIGGNTNSNIGVVDFSADTLTQQACVGLFKDFPFCYDATSDTIYQLQDAAGTSSRMTRIAQLRRTSGFVSDFSIAGQLTTNNYPQGITTDGHWLYVVTGNSWSSSTSGAHNDAWYLYRMSFNGKVVDVSSYRRSSMGLVIGVGTTTSHEPQAISMHRGRLAHMQYIGSAVDTRVVIFTEDKLGVQLRAIPKNYHTQYRDLADVGILASNLVAGSSIRTIVAAMADNSSVTFSLSNETALASDVGIDFGSITVHRVNAFRAYATTVESSTRISSTVGPRVSVVSVYDTVQSPAVYLSNGSKTVTIAYSDTAVVGSGTIAVAGILTCNTLSIHLTHGSGTNPVVLFDYTRPQIDYLIANAIPLYLSDTVGAISVTLTNSGITLSGGSGSPIIRRIVTS